ncbi:helix-turn-helix domain-containing protein [Reinekea sp.]|jgi:transcriptional regulator with XRE-family HTH domain|uniref:helix-turn-helix domain-containing protein n=1 Tax=Reinekea sp. TaxID=1970455 RepID=UPI00398A4358
MHPAEFKTLREALGLTISTLVKVIDVDERTIRKWESGKKKLPQGVIDSLNAIDGLLNATADKLFNFHEQDSQSGVVLYRFIEEEDLLNEYPEFEGLPMSTFGVVLFRIRQRFIDLNIPVSIEYK